MWMAARITAADGSEEQLAIFSRLLLTVPLRFRVIASEEERLFAHVNLRERITGAHACMSRSTTQRVYELCQWRDKRAKSLGVQNATAGKLAVVWNESVTMAKSSEPITEHFMALAFRLWEQLLSHPSLREPILWAERTWGKNNPFNAVMNMEAVVIKAKGSTESAEWLLHSMIYYVKKGFMSSGELSVRTLTGKGSGNRGILDMWNLKRAVLTHVSSTVLDSMDFTPASKARASGALFILHRSYVLQCICHTYHMYAYTHLTNCSARFHV